MSLRILIVDDEECIRDSMRIYFTEKGYDVVTLAHPNKCGGTENSLCHGREECADILIIDQWMPEMTGIEYLSRRHDWGCRSMGQHKALISANLSEQLCLQAMQLGCVVFEKPVRFEQIEAWMNKVVNCEPHGI